MILALSNTFNMMRFTILLLSLPGALSLPQIARLFTIRDGSDDYSSILVSPAIHTDNETASQIDFQSILLKPGRSLDRDVFHSTPETRLPSISLPAGTGVTFISPNGSHGGDSVIYNKLWALTYPLSCKDVESNKDDKITISSYNIGGGNRAWNLHEIDKPPSEWKSTGRYFGGAFSSQALSPSVFSTQSFSQDDAANYSSTLYTFGGMCADYDDDQAFSNLHKSRLSSDIWRFTNSSEKSTDNTNVTWELAKNEMSPVPEAGFTVTQLPPKYSHEGAQSVLLLGGFASSSQFIGFSRVALYNLPSESWTYISVNTSNAKGIEPRAGHSTVLSNDGKKVIVYGGWVGDVNTPATPSLFMLHIGAKDNWKLEIPKPEKENLGPTESLWGHAAANLDGDVMMVTSGFITGTGSKQDINNDTFFYNLTSNSWMKSYSIPVTKLKQKPTIQHFGDPNVAILSSVIGGLLGITTAACFILYCSRKKSYVYNKLHKPRRVRRRDGTLDMDSDAGLVENGSSNGSLVIRPPRSRYTYRSRSDDTDPLRIYSRNLRFARHMARQEEIKENARLQQELLQNEKQERDVAAWVHRYAELDSARASSSTAALTAPGAAAISMPRGAAEYSSDQDNDGSNKTGWDFSTDQTSTGVSTSEDDSSWANAYPASSVYSGEHHETSQGASTHADSEHYDSLTNEREGYSYPIPPPLLSTPQQVYSQFREPQIVVTAPPNESSSLCHQAQQQQENGLERSGSTSSCSFMSIHSRFEVDREIIRLPSGEHDHERSLTPTQWSVSRNSSIYDSLRKPMHNRLEILRSPQGYIRGNIGSVVRHYLTRMPSSNYGSYNSVTARQLAPIPSQSPELPESPKMPLQRRGLVVPPPKENILPLPNQQASQQPEQDVIGELRTVSPNLMPPAILPGLSSSPPPDDPSFNLDLENIFPRRVIERMGSYSIFEGQFEDDDQTVPAPLTVTKTRGPEKYRIPHDNVDDCLPLPRRRRLSQQRPNVGSSIGSTTRSFWDNVRNKHLKRHKSGFSPRLELRQENRHKWGHVSHGSRSLSGAHVGIPEAFNGSTQGLNRTIVPSPDVFLPARPASTRTRSLSSSIKRHGASIISRGKSWSSTSSSSSSSKRRRKRSQPYGPRPPRQAKDRGKAVDNTALAPSGRGSSQMSQRPSPLLWRDTAESGSMLDGEDYVSRRVVQVMFTAPRGPLRIVNASPLTVRKGSFASSVTTPTSGVYGSTGSGSNLVRTPPTSIDQMEDQRKSLQESLQSGSGQEMRPRSSRLSDPREGAVTGRERIGDLERGNDRWKVANDYGFPQETEAQRQYREQRELERRLRYGLGIGFAV